MNILGITIDERLSVSGHVNNILGSCSSSIYALRTLRARGMTGQTLHDVTRATTIGRLMYASPSWWGFLSESDLNRLESFVRRTKRGGFLPDDAPSFRDMAARADSNLFGSIISNPHHVLRCLCRESPAIQYNLRSRPHPFDLPERNNKNFLPRMMYLDIYSFLLYLALFGISITPQYIADSFAVMFCYNFVQYLVNGCVL